MNALIQSHELNVAFSMPSSLSVFDHLEYNTLITIKWILTFAFSAFYLITSMITINILFKNKKYIRITIGVYIAIILVSAIFMTLGYFLPTTYKNMYSFSRYLMGLVQSPLILMILIPAFKISEKE
ncbi:MAG: hypothetical protein A3F72_14845 [Bacteroidetes bacterium RIFCSPLOWO2_12_FULL_35_15]|nr:MAG: hypothetical protein A3F72_14845 [Bacteroidetes bacterium RIFCSPLOWO2_12_FULL_35_15]